MLLHPISLTVGFPHPGHLLLFICLFILIIQIIQKKLQRKFLDNVSQKVDSQILCFTNDSFMNSKSSDRIDDKRYKSDQIESSEAGNEDASGLKEEDIQTIMLQSNVSRDTYFDIDSKTHIFRSKLDPEDLNDLIKPPLLVLILNFFNIKFLKFNIKFFLFCVQQIKRI